MRHWAGIVDIVPDSSPILGPTPVKNLFINCGWGTGGFKAIPAGGLLLAHSLATGRTHPLAEEFRPRSIPQQSPHRRRRGRRHRSLRAAVMIIIRCPDRREQRTEEELSYGGEGDISRALEPDRLSDEQWTEYLFMRTNPKGLMWEQWCCADGCGQWFKVRRDSVGHEIREVRRFDERHA